MNNEPFTQTFLVSGRFYGTAPRGLRSDQDFPSRVFPPDSLLFFCEACGEVFGKCPVVDKDNNQQRWRSIAGRCGKCPSDLVFQSPGTVWLSWDADYQDAMPKELLEKELIELIDFLNSKEGKENG